MKRKKHKTMQEYSIDELMDIVKDNNASSNDRANAEYEIRYRAALVVALNKGGDRPVYTPPNP